MFDKENFIRNCIEASADSFDAVSEVVKEIMYYPSKIISQLGEPEHAGIYPLYRSKALTIINFTWAPCMSLMPHNHQMAAVIGIYAGREDNIIWRRDGNSIIADKALSPGTGDVISLDSDAIHSVLNPLEKMTCAIHVYEGDFFAPEKQRSEWDHETLEESPWDIEKVKSIFTRAEERFKN
ncbi:MAG TPA: hypothetical protein ENJ60_12070 [Aeromonadales bacterium]|nr:hypothetical protein [Aeromonadales bacterium]